MPDDEPSCGNCCDKYKELHKNLCEGKGSPKDPIIHDKNKDRNSYPCGEDCSDQQTVEKCYTDYLNKQRCEFGNTGDPYQGCSNYANDHQLLCFTAVKDVCNNVVKNRTGCVCDKNGKCHTPA
jgi:hypothetical protein